MTNNLRKLIQSKLNLIDNLESGEVVGDDIIKEGEYYFGYKINSVGNKFNLDYSNKSEYYNLTGYLSTKGGSLYELDRITDDIVSKLEELHFMCSTSDVSTLDTTIRKVLITATVKYDTLDNLLK